MKQIINGVDVKCPCYIDRPLHRYDKGCLIQSQAFSEQQTEEKPILRCDEIVNCPIKENYKQLKHKEQECEGLKSQLDYEIQKFEVLEEKLKLKEEEFKKIEEIINMWEVCVCTIGGYSDLAEFDERRLSEIKDILKVSEVE